MIDPRQLPPPVVMQDNRRNELLDPNGRRGLVVNTTDTIEGDPMTGSRRVTHTEQFPATADGVTVRDPSTTPLYWCTICNRGPLTEPAVKRCHCGDIVCGNCVVNDGLGNQCANCAHAPWWKRLCNWISQIV